MSDFSPREIVSELDRFIVGQADAKRAVAIALRNRWRRQRLPSPLRDEVMPKNILMIGPTGVGKTEIARRLSKLAQAPFLKVEATKFTEVGYVGRDVEQIIRDLVENAMVLVRTKRRQDVHAEAEANVEEIILEALIGKNASQVTRDSFLKKLNTGALDDHEIEITLKDTGSSFFQLPDLPGGAIGAINLSDMLGKTFGQKTKTRKLSVRLAKELLLAEESDALLDEDLLKQEAVLLTENQGIVFLDEIDKVCARSERHGSDVSREGVQRDLLPLLEGTTVTTKYGPVKTDHILFIASGAFHLAKPADLLPELQGRLPIRVELKALTTEDFKRILTEPESNLITQYKALMQTEYVTLEFSQEAIETLAHIAADLNQRIENIGARRLHTVLEKVLDEISFSATDRANETVTIDGVFVKKQLEELSKNTDLSKFIL